MDLLVVLFVMVRQPEVVVFNQALKAALASCQQNQLALQEYVDAIDRNLAVIAFAPDGMVLDANERFLQTVGYHRDEVVGRHHRLFCDAGYAASAEYAGFWESLRRGQAQSRTYARLHKNGQRIWLESTYFPVLHDGRVARIIKFASDVTEKTLHLREQEAVVEALNRSLAVIEFSPEGEVLNANSNFLDCLGYRLEEIRGKHHRMFCKSEFYQQNPQFWADLKRGQFKSGRFERVGKQGEPVWLEATYNPVPDETGAVIKIIKFASNITARAKQGAAVRQAAHTAHEISDQTVALASQGAELLQQTVENAGQVTTEVGNASALLQQLAQQSKDISAMVSTIRGIAEQTNLLALNAAIEAARAGEYGRGFAVVADEVRNLAARTSSSTVEIENVVKRNTELTGRVVGSMSDAMAQAERGNQLVSDAFAKITEIRQGAIHVSQTVADLSLTQQNG